MSFSNPNLKGLREKILYKTDRTDSTTNTTNLTVISPSGLSDGSSSDFIITDSKNEGSLFIKGQGVIIFKAASKDVSSITVKFSSSVKSSNLILELGLGHLTLTKNDTVIASSESVGLVNNEKAFYWVSLDAQKQNIRFGIGEARLETQKFCHLFTSPQEDKQFLESLEVYHLSQNQASPLKLLRDPILNNVPLRVKNTDELTMDMIASEAYMPKANLSAIGQKLYDNISGKNFTLNTPEFPDFTQAIENSIVWDKGWCYNKLKSKAGEFGEASDKQVYLRITLGQNGGESPGIPYVMEIWPPDCFSPIHNHAGANAVIRVFHGQINVTLYPYLGASEPFGNEIFSEGDITWISPDLNQIHFLKNPNQRGLTCITIQCYMYDNFDLGHYDYFDYLNDKNVVEHYEPDSDMDFVDFKNTIRKEWDAFKKNSL